MESEGQVDVCRSNTSKYLKVFFCLKKKTTVWVYAHKLTKQGATQVEGNITISI